MFSNKIWTFWGISITAHVVVIGLLQKEPLLFVAPTPGNVVHVRLVNTPSITQETVKTVEIKKSPIKKEKLVKSVLKKSIPVFQIKTNVIPTALSSTIIVDAASKPENKKTPSSDITLSLKENKNRVMKYIQDELTNNFNYPSIAIHKGWQGKVLLGFQLKRNGIIENIYIAKSSGYVILDRAASKALANIHSIPHLYSNRYNSFNYLSSDWQLPVIYKFQKD